MTYHTNHWGIDKSVWENKDFDGKVMVYFDKNITQTDINAGIINNQGLTEGTSPLGVDVNDLSDSSN